MGTKGQRSCPGGMASAAKGAAGGTAAQKGRHGRKCRMDIGEVRQMLKDGYGVGETAAELGTSKKLLHAYLQKHPKLIPVRKK